MKYLTFYFFLIFSVFSYSLQGQDPMDQKEYYIGTGYSIGWGQFSQFNSILNTYNDNKTQEKEFNEVHIPNGFAFSIGTHISIFNVEAGFSQRQQRKKTEFSENEILYRRDARLRINTAFIGLGLFVPTTSRFGMGVNVYGDRHAIRLSTREAEKKSISRSSFVSPVVERRYGMTLDATFYFGDMDDHGTKLMIKPFYSFIFKDIDAKPFDELLNGEGGSEDLNGNYSHFGLKFIITYSVVK